MQHALKLAILAVASTAIEMRTTEYDDECEFDDHLEDCREAVAYGLTKTNDEY